LLSELDGSNRYEAGDLDSVIEGVINLDRSEL